MTIEQFKDYIKQKINACQTEIRIIKSDKTLPVDWKEATRRQLNISRYDGQQRVLEEILKVMKKLELPTPGTEKQLTEETKKNLKEFEERLDACVDEVCAQIKIEYDEKVELMQNATESGQILMAQVVLTPRIVRTTMPIKYLGDE